MFKFVKFAVAAAVASGVAYMFATGQFSADEARQIGRSAFYKGINTAEKLTEIGKPGSFSDASVCRENLREIEMAKRKVADQKMMTVGTPTIQEIEAALGRKLPRCPGGGAYTTGPLVQLPTCSIGSGDSIERKDDHVITQF